jgi:hypothetical protein
MTRKLSNKKMELAELEEALGGDRELVLFFLCWLKHNRNATEAYKELHPHCKHKSCGVMGARMLARVSLDIIVSSYGLGIDTYLENLKNGLNATKIEHVAVGKYKNGRTKTVVRVSPDYDRRDKYFDDLGELLGIKGKTNKIAVQVNNNVNNVIQDKKQKYGI